MEINISNLQISVLIVMVVLVVGVLFIGYAIDEWYSVKVASIAPFFIVLIFFIIYADTYHLRTELMSKKNITSIEYIEKYEFADYDTKIGNVTYSDKNGILQYDFSSILVENDELEGGAYLATVIYKQKWFCFDVKNEEERIVVILN